MRVTGQRVLPPVLWPVHRCLGLSCQATSGRQTLSVEMMGTEVITCGQELMEQHNLMDGGV